jgi:hypothetical protein
VVNSTRTVGESNYRNDENVGPPYDAAPILIQAPIPSNLVGTTLAVSPTTPTWGSPIQVTAQITNQSSGSSPQTRALIALTPQGLDYGGTNTVGIGNIDVPPLGPYQTINLVQDITLPAVPPVLLANYTNFALTMTQDADYIANDLYPHTPDQGVGLDQTAIAITTSPTSTATPGPLADLAASSVLVSKSTVTWGSSFQVSTEVQNLGQAASGPFLVQFLLTGQGGSSNDAIFLGETTIPSLAAGYSQPLTQTLQLPNRLPAGVTLNAVGYSRILVLVDPENVVNESLYTNNDSLSAPFIVRLPGSAATVPTTQAAGALPSVQTLAQQSQNKAKFAAEAKRAAALQARAAANPKKKLHRKRPRKGQSLAKISLNVAEELYKLPGQAFDAIKRSV